MEQILTFLQNQLRNDMNWWNSSKTEPLVKLNMEAFRNGAKINLTTFLSAQIADSDLQQQTDPAVPAVKMLISKSQSCHFISMQMGSTVIHQFKCTQRHTAGRSLALSLSPSLCLRIVRRHTHFKHYLKCSSKISPNTEYTNSMRENG